MSPIEEIGKDAMERAEKAAKEHARTILKSHKKCSTVFEEIQTIPIGPLVAEKMGWEFDGRHFFEPGNKKPKACFVPEGKNFVVHGGTDHFPNTKEGYSPFAFVKTVEKLNDAKTFEWFKKNFDYIAEIDEKQRKDWASKQKKKTDDVKQSKILIELIDKQNWEFFHDDLREPYACIIVNGHKEVWGVQSSTFRLALQKLYWESVKTPIGGEGLKEAVDILACRGIFDGPARSLDLRVSEHDKSFWYDLCDNEGRVVKITSSGWKIISDPPPIFRRYSHQKPQVLPSESGGSLEDAIFPFLNIKDDDQKLLFLCALVSYLIPNIPHPIINLAGEQGSAKSTFARIVHNIIDPAKPELLSLPDDKRELGQQLHHHWCPVYDNVSHVGPAISDELCRAVTGGGNSKRKLFTDEEDVIFEYKRCIVLTGINVCPRRPDLLDRSLIIELDRIPKSEYRTERRFWADFEPLLPVILGGILDVLAKAMSHYETLSDEREYERMADFCEWGCAIAIALGHNEEKFLSAVANNTKKQNREAIDASDVATVVIALMETGNYWDGTPSELLADLKKVAEKSQIDTKARSWPKRPETLTRRLKEVKTNLEAEGITFVRDRTGKRRWVEIKTRVTGDTPKERASASKISGDACGDISDAEGGLPSFDSPLNEAKNKEGDANDAKNDGSQTTSDTQSLPWGE